MIYVHRLEWEKHYGKIPKGICVLHKCDNPPCHNIEHLFLGTKADNMRDKTWKGRGKNPNQRMTIVQVKEMRDRWNRDKFNIPYGGKEIYKNNLAKEYGICKKNVEFIIYKMSFKNI